MIITLCISLPFGNRTWLHSSAVEIIPKIVMRDELVSPPEYTPCVVCLPVLNAEITLRAQ